MANGDDAYEVMRCRRLERRAGVRIMKEFNMLFEDTQSDCIYLWNTTELLMGPLEILTCITLSDNPLLIQMCLAVFQTGNLASRTR